MARAKEVDRWFATYDNPMKPVVQRMREIILDADPRIGECIKWQTPTFTYEGNLASFFPKSKQHASLMFHQGAKIPGTHRRLEGTGATGRVMKIASVADADAARADLEKIVVAWCDWRDGATGAKKTSKTTKTRKRASPKRKTPAAAKRRSRSSARR